MTLAATIGACIAAVASVGAITFTIREARRRRLTEIADIVDEIRAAAEWGPTATLHRRDAQRKLQSRLKNLDLPKVRDLAAAKLDSDTESVALARAAFEEVRRKLEK